MSSATPPPPAGTGPSDPQLPEPTYVRSLEDVGAGLSELGGKGAALAQLAAAALPVPPGFHLTTAAYAAFLRAHDLSDRLDALVRAGDSAAARRLFADHELPEDVAAAVRRAYADLGSPPVAVRSSATAEDLPDLSFAGQQDSFLGLQGEQAVLDGVRRCWASLWNDRAVAYRRQHRQAGAGMAMAVVVQRLVEADAAGVAFTADPVTGDRTVVVVNAVPGLAEALVSGEAAAEVYRVDRASRRVLAVDLPAGADRSLDDAQLGRLTELVLAVAELTAGDVDVEWCRAGDEIWLVQARPITATGHADPWNDSRSGDFLWTNTNVGEAIPDVMTPATWSMVQVFMSDAMATASIPPYVGYGRIGGRVYLNVSVMKALSGAVGVGERQFRNLTEEVFGRLPDGLEIPPVDAPRLRVLRAVVPMALHVLSEARRDARNLDVYLADHLERCQRRRTSIAEAADGRALARLWTDTLEPEFHRVSWMLSAATRSSGASFVATRRRLQRLVGNEAANALTAGLGSQSGPLASLGLLDGIELVERGEISAADFAVRYGHRGPHEFELSRPRPGEDPDWLPAQLAARGRSGEDYRQRLEAQERTRDAAWLRLRSKHPWQARWLGRQLRVWGRISRDRERARSEVIRYFWVLRDYVRRAGELTGLGESIFFLEGPEIQRSLLGETLPPGLVREREAAYAAYRQLPPYPALIRGRFDPFAWAADPDRRSDLYLPGAREPAQDTVRGFPGSAGVVEGVVRLLRDVEEGSQLQPGEVLVTTSTNVGWTPLFPRAAAIVTDVGAPLSHAAIVARELGIPAVVGCGNATMVLATGDRVRVDGAAGTVELLADAPAPDASHEAGATANTSTAHSGP